MSKPTIQEAIRILVDEGEQVERSGLGAYKVNGVSQTAQEVIDYAHDLRPWFGKRRVKAG